MQRQLADAKRIGFYRVHDLGSGRLKWACRCIQCDKEQAWGWASDTSPNFMQQNSSHHGWEHTRKGPVCPTCAQKGKDKMTAPTITKAPDPKLQRKVFALLEDHFDEEAKLYRDNWSDERIAKEVGASAVFVETIRRGAYGELAEDPRVTAMRKDIASLGQEISDMQTTLLAKLDELEKKQTELNSRVTNLAFRGVKKSG